MDYSFLPNAERAIALNLHMRTQLANSLAYLSQQLKYFSYNEQSLNQIINGLRQGERYSAMCYALYTHLVLSISNQEEKEIISTLNKLCEQKPLKKGRPEPISIDSEKFNGNSYLLKELMNAEEGTDFQIQAADKESTVVFSERLKTSMDLIDYLLPQLGGEIEALVSQVIMVEPSPESESDFAGGSSIMLWGGMFLNVNVHEEDIALIEVLAHESAHMLLFAFASEEPLTSNAEDARYDSPLRDDMRPMEGIYHATYVSGRMYLAMKILFESGKLSDKEKEYATGAMKRDLKAFKDGYSVVKEYGELTQTGKEVMDACITYMRQYL